MIISRLCYRRLHLTTVCLWYKCVRYVSKFDCWLPNYVKNITFCYPTKFTPSTITSIARWVDLFEYEYWGFLNDITEKLETEVQFVVHTYDDNYQYLFFIQRHVPIQWIDNVGRLVMIRVSILEKTHSSSLWICAGKWNVSVWIRAASKRSLLVSPYGV